MELKEVQERGGPWAGEVLTFVVRWQGLQRSPWALQAMILEVHWEVVPACQGAHRRVPGEAYLVQPFHVVDCSLVPQVQGLQVQEGLLLVRSQGACWASLAAYPALVFFPVLPFVNDLAEPAHVPAFYMP